MLLFVLVLLGCRADGLVVSAEVSDAVPTVVAVEWAASGVVDQAWIEHGPDADYGTRVSADLSGEVLLLGLKEQQEVHLRLVVEGDGVERVSEDVVVTTGALSSQVPALSLETSVDDGLDEGLLVMSHVQSPGAAMIVDQDGDIVWWWALSEDLRISRAVLSQDGQSVLILPVNHLGEHDHGLERVSLDGRERERIIVDDAHHDMVELPDGTLTFLVHDRRELEGYGEIYGDKLVELAPDGTTTELWSTWDTFAYDPEDHVLEGATWTHANAIDYLPEDDAYLVGLLGLSAIVRLSRDGSVEWILGSDDSDFTTPEGEAHILDHHHQLDAVDGGLVVFENGPPSRSSSRAVELDLDLDAMTATEVWSHWPDPELYTYSMGSVQRLPSDRTVVGFSVNGQVDVVEADGTVSWRLSSGLGGAFGYVEWLRPPE